MNGRHTVTALLNIVRLELRRHRRSRGTVGTLAGLTLFCTFWSVHNLSISTYPPNASLRNDGVFSVIDPGQNLLILDAATSVFVGPLLLCAGVLLGVGTVTTPRTEGTLRTIQTFPYSRRSVFVGLVLSRLVVIAVVVAVLTICTVVAASLAGVQLSRAMVFGFAVLLTLHAAGGVAVGAMVSTLRSEPIAVYLLGVVAAVGLLVMGGLLSSQFMQAGLFAPQTAFHVALAGLHENWTTLFQQALADATGDFRPLFGSMAAGVLVLCAWVVVPTLLGAVGYERWDLNR
ncbi:ABC transporter permease [Halobacterium sp. KA-4]|uniref:ABC transporter permease subunit n=1 Tax=Halobacterium sp. KA-4 TaxID=2896367 RepID=UPI001E646D72|nr:ABC transporter permease subunit [Halobacterium sp. KA-4]MCD2201337.1 ABC transporter permease [Halobacterium sp. KA-4]